MMSGVFDRLQHELDNRLPVGGVTALDLADLPGPLKKVMLLILRESEMTYPALWEAMSRIPEDERLSRNDLDAALDRLHAEGWLIRLGLDELITYKVNLRHKAASQLGTGVWGSLGTRVRESGVFPRPDTGEKEG